MKKMELIKREGGYYVPKAYEYRDNGTKKEPMYIDDLKAVPPVIRFNEDAEKWELCFVSFETYENDKGIGLSYFFDTKEEIIDFITIGKK